MNLLCSIASKYLVYENHFLLNANKTKNILVIPKCSVLFQLEEGSTKFHGIHLVEILVRNNYINNAKILNI